MPRRPIKKKFKSQSFDEIFQQIIMIHGKKKLAYRIFQNTLNLISTQTEENAFVVLERAIRNTTPSVQIKTRRKGGSVYPLPVELPIDRGISRAVRWIVQSAKKRSANIFYVNLSNEIIDASKKVGNAFQKKQEVQKIAEKNPRLQNYKKKK
jgi:small subunit ribosomal protein S7